MATVIKWVQRLDVRKSRDGYELWRVFVYDSRTVEKLVFRGSEEKCNKAGFLDLWFF